MKTLSLLFILVGLLSTSAHADLAVFINPPFAVRVERVAFVWPWVPGEGIDAWAFSIKCGPQSHTYTNTPVTTDPTVRAVPLSSLIVGAGLYFCVISANNVAGESLNSEEITFTVRQLGDQ